MSYFVVGGTYKDTTFKVIEEEVDKKNLVHLKPMKKQSNTGIKFHGKMLIIVILAL